MILASKGKNFSLYHPPGTTPRIISPQLWYQTTSEEKGKKREPTKLRARTQFLRVLSAKIRGTRVARGLTTPAVKGFAFKAAVTRALVLSSVTSNALLLNV